MHSGRGPKLRSACEACHERKQRCIIPENGGACQSCLASFRQCYFVPRYRAGRPRRNKSEQDVNAETRQTVMSSVLEAITKSSQASKDTDGGQTDRLPTEHKASPLVDSSSCDPQMLSMIGLGDLETLTSGFDCFDASFNPTFDTKLYNSSSSSSSPNTRTPLEDPIPQWADESYFNTQPPVPSPIDHLPALVEKFTELHRYSERMRQGSYTPTAFLDPRGPVQPMLVSINTICTQAMAVVGSSAPTHDPAMTAIILANLIKVASLCEHIISSSEWQLISTNAIGAQKSPQLSASAGMGPNQMEVRGPNFEADGSGATEVGVNLEFVFMLKQLDLNLTQARVCLSQLGRHRDIQGFVSTLETSAALQTRISALIDRACS